MNSIYQYQTEQLEGKKVILFGCSSKTKAFALRLLSKRIRFDFFLAPFPCDPYEMPSILNKSIITIDECRMLSDYVIVAPYSESGRAEKYLQEQSLKEHYVPLECLNPLILNASDVVVYGTGGRSKRVYNDVGSLVHITYYCDSDKSKEGTMLRGKRVIHPSQLGTLSEDMVVIIASTAFEEINRMLKDYHVKEECIFLVEYEMVVHDTLLWHFTMHTIFFQNIVRDLADKQIIVYGQKAWVEDWAEILELVDIEVTEKIERLSEKEDGTIYSLEYYDMKDMVILLADSWSASMQEALLELNIAPKQIIFPKEYSSYALPDWLYQCKGERYNLDPTIGQIILGRKEEIPGFVQYRYHETDLDAIRILTLGGSTTTGYVTKHRPWSFFLSEILKEKGISHVIYCGGVPGYIASQELLRLIRDGIWLKPDIVLSFSGVNNIALWEVSNKNPFLHKYQEQLFEQLQNSPVAHNSPYGIHYGIHYGINPQEDSFAYWLIQMKIMHGICKEMGIQYKAFLQPMLLSKKRYGEGDVDILYQYYSALWDKRQKGLKYYDPNSGECSIYTSRLEEEINHFRKEGGKIKEEWFTDLTWIFDEVDHVYIDPYHVNENANKIIAERILENIVLKKEI